MNCTVTMLCDLDEADRLFIMNHCCKPDSDFHTKLLDKELTEEDGWIAVVRDQGEIIGWCRTEVWHDVDTGEAWDTLEAFVRDEWRRRRVCQFAATGLVATVFPRAVPKVAIFNASMIATCRRMAVGFVEYEKTRSGWEKSRY
jgi:hypothetical protein